MKVLPFASTALAAALALTPPALATTVQGQETTTRVISVQNGTGYTVSSPGQNTVSVDTSTAYRFSALEEYELTRIVLTNGTSTSYAQIGKDTALMLDGVAYPITYEVRVLPSRQIVTQATVQIPAGTDNLMLSAVAQSTHCTVTASAPSYVVLSAAQQIVAKGESVTFTAKPNRQSYAISGAVLTVDGNKTLLSLSKGTAQSSQGYHFSMDEQGVVTVYGGNVRADATIQFQTMEKTAPDSNEVLVTVYTDNGITTEQTRTILAKGSNCNITLLARAGYRIDTVELEEGGRTVQSSPYTNTVLVGQNAYRIIGKESKCTLYLTDLQHDVTVTARSVFDTEAIVVETSAGTGVRINKDVGNTVKAGSKAEFEISVTDDADYQLSQITLQVGEYSRTVDADSSSIRVGGIDYRMTTDADGIVHLYVDDITAPIRVTATSQKTDHRKSITIHSTSHVSITKNISGSSVTSGQKVTFVITPNAGYGVHTVTLKVGAKTATANAGDPYIAVNGVRYTMTQDGEGVVRLYLTSVTDNITVSATAKVLGTVASSGTGSGSNGQITLNRAAKIPFFQGYNGKFYPDALLSRADAVQMLARLTNMEQGDAYPSYGFVDVQSDAYYQNALNAFAYGGIVDLNTTYFRPEVAITRGEFVKLLYRLETMDAYSPNTRFTDVSADAPYAAAVAYCTDHSWLRGYPDGTFRPHHPITRAEAAAMVNRIMGRTLGSSDISGTPYADVPYTHWAYNDILIASSYQW